MHALHVLLLNALGWHKSHRRTLYASQIASASAASFLLDFTNGSTNCGVIKAIGRKALFGCVDFQRFYLPFFVVFVMVLPHFRLMFTNITSWPIRGRLRSGADHFINRNSGNKKVISVDTRNLSLGR